MKTVLFGILCLFIPSIVLGADPPKTILLIAGTKSHGPGEHEYEKGARHLAHCINTSPNLKGFKAEVATDGWPKDEKAFDNAATVFLFSDGSDREEQAHPLLREKRLATMAKLMERGVGFVAIHYTIFVPTKKGGDEFLDWCGGYFDYESGAKPRGWYSKIKTCTGKVDLASPKHPVSRGLKPFELREEFYYNMRLAPAERGLSPILSATLPDEKESQVVAWAIERKNGGRGFGYTGGHFHSNWQDENVRRMVLNALIWTAHGEVPEGGVRSIPPEPEKKPAAPPLVEGKFGLALNARAGHAEAKHQPAYQKPPLTVECWVKLDGAAGFNLLVANNFKESKTHWEVYSIAGSGNFSAFLPGCTPDTIDSGVKITDGKWHYLAMIREAERVRLFIDGKQVKETTIKTHDGAVKDGPLWFGAYRPQNLGCDGLVDEVRLSGTIRKIDGVPDKPFVADKDTLGLWHFDKAGDQGIEDGGSLKNSAVLASTAKPQAASGPSSDTELDYHPADTRLQAILIDRSTDESFVSIKADTTGRLFVGGREALFVYEPDEKGGYRPRRELFRFPPDAWVAGIEVRGDDLYVLTASAFIASLAAGRSAMALSQSDWSGACRLTCTSVFTAWPGARKATCISITATRCSATATSVGRITGGTGRIFTKDGVRVPYTGNGGVFRVRPGRQQFPLCGRRLARAVRPGVRPPLEPVHQRQRPRKPARPLHTGAGCCTSHRTSILPGREAGSPRNCPTGADLVEAMANVAGRGVPVGMAYYDEPLFPQEYRNSLLEVRWDLLTVQRHTIEKRGASFSSKEQPFLVGRVRRGRSGSRSVAADASS